MAKKETLRLPLIALRGKVIYPSNKDQIFDVGRAVTLKAVQFACSCDLRAIVCTQKDEAKDDVSENDIYNVGTLISIKHVNRLPGGNVRITVDGIERVEIKDVIFENDSLFAVAIEAPFVRGDEIIETAYLRTAKSFIKDIAVSDVRSGKDLNVEDIADPNDFIDAVAVNLKVNVAKKQEILSEESTEERFRLLLDYFNSEAEIAKLEKKISAQVRKNIDKSQKEYYLREQIRAIHTELGDDIEEKDVLTEKLKEKKLPADIEDKALKEVARLDKMQPSSPEYNVIRGYLEWLIDLPWNEETTDTESIADCVKVLEADHYGLEKVKQRITEYLAVLKLTKSMNAPILCLVGPPGVGKTSIAKSIANALGRKFVRMSLGGVKDEAEIRGHRRTYVGAIPGRIIYAMKNAGTINPVILLDEIDKVSSDMRGDPASALLEVLDPEQNNSFRDRFLEVPYDLSKVLFITTANSMQTIPEPLLDRMELIELSGYTLQEKREIAKRYLVPKRIGLNGITSEQVEFSDEGIDSIVENYTREAGVRTLEREIDTVCRKVAVVYADHPEMEKKTITEDSVEQYLGVKKYLSDKNELEDNEVGVATGLAWTAVGGTTLNIEVMTMKGKGNVLLTGKLGEVMQESAKTAFTYIRAHADEFKIAEEVFENTDVHIHVPEGATPKDGPSAGITMATAILSALTKRPVRKDVAMTGEVTLRGRVLPIGGLKEKSLAAYRIGIKNLIIPKENKKDVEDIPENIRSQINFVLATNVSEVFANALV